MKAFLVNSAKVAALSLVMALYAYTGYTVAVNTIEPEVVIQERIVTQIVVETQTVVETLEVVREWDNVFTLGLDADGDLTELSEGDDTSEYLYVITVYSDDGAYPVETSVWVPFTDEVYAGITLSLLCSDYMIEVEAIGGNTGKEPAEGDGF